MSKICKHRIAFGDFQTPNRLAIDVCQKLANLGIRPDVVIEPTCGIGSFVIAACNAFPMAKTVYGFEINRTHLETLQNKVKETANEKRIQLQEADFFTVDWRTTWQKVTGSVLVVGNFPWVTNSVQGTMNGKNLPEKSNFQRHIGFDAISGKANFDISECMLLEVLSWFSHRDGDIAMLVKTAVARKILAHAERQSAAVRDAFIIGIDAKKDFGAAVEACLLVLRISENKQKASHDYTCFENFNDTKGRRIGHRHGITVGDLTTFNSCAFLVGESPQKWRSGIKHDASAVMEFTQTERGLVNGFGDLVDIENNFLFPLLKGSDIGSNKPWRGKYTLVTQRSVGEETSSIEQIAPKTWKYLVEHGSQLDNRGSTIYAKNPRFSIFGIGNYAFRPWRIAICGLYKVLRFRLVEPIDGQTVMFDDTVYYLSFETASEARKTLAKLNSEAALGLLGSLIFWDEKRPIKTSILNVLDWSRITNQESESIVS